MKYVALVVAFTLVSFVTGFSISTLTAAEDRTGAISAYSVSRELRCHEDEDIVTTLGSNGLPYAFCQQVIER